MTAAEELKLLRQAQVLRLQAKEHRTAAHLLEAEAYAVLGDEESALFYRCLAEGNIPAAREHHAAASFTSIAMQRAAALSSLGEGEPGTCLRCGCETEHGSFCDSECVHAHFNSLGARAA